MNLGPPIFQVTLLISYPYGTLIADLALDWRKIRTQEGTNMADIDFASDQLRLLKIFHPHAMKKNKCRERKKHALRPLHKRKRRDENTANGEILDEENILYERFHGGGTRAALFRCGV